MLSPTIMFLYGTSLFFSSALLGLLNIYIFTALVLCIYSNRQDLAVKWQLMPVVVYVPLFIFLFLVFSLLWAVMNGVPIDQSYFVLTKYKKVVFLFILMVGFFLLPRDIIERLNHAFWLGVSISIVIIALYAIGTKSGFTRLLLGPEEVSGGWNIGYTLQTNKSLLWLGGAGSPTIGRNYISLGYFIVVYVAYTLGNYFFSAERRIQPMPLIASVLGAVLVVFIYSGRTGLLLMSVLICFFAWRLCSRVGSERSRMFIIVICFFSIVLMFVTTPAGERFWATLDLFSEPIQASPAELNLRLVYFYESIHAFLKHPFFGLGAGAFATVMENSIYMPLDQARNHFNPHSEFLNSMVQGGLPLTLMWCYFLYLLWKSMDKRYVAVLVVLSVGFVLNSTIFDYADGYFTVMVVALLYSRGVVKY